jgi:hypothetical protein
MLPCAGIAKEKYSRSGNRRTYSRFALLRDGPLRAARKDLFLRLYGTAKAVP